MTVILGSSLPSIPAALLDVPEVTNFKGTFVYSFFSKDELNNESATWIDSVNVTHHAKPGAQPSSIDYARNSPRYIELSWNKIEMNFGRVQEFVNIRLEQNSNKIVDENQLDLKYYDEFDQQELDFTSQTQAYLSKLYGELYLNSQNSTLNDAAAAINERTPDGITPDFITSYLNYANSRNRITNNSPQNSTSPLSQISTNFQIRNKVYGNLFFDKVMNDSLLQLNNTYIRNIQNQFDNQFLTKEFENRFNGSQYDFYIENPIETRIAENVTDFGTVVQPTGYVIERYKVQSNGQLTDKRTFYIEDPSVTSYFDNLIAYNQTYVYDIRTIAGLQTLSFNSEQRANVVSTFLISSKKTRIQVVCEDNKPPEPPTDFFIQWDYGLKKPILTWNFPIDTRRHIKYFQVFRRQNRIINGIDVRPAQQSFELIKMYDFNDLQNGNGVFYRIANQTYSFQNGDDQINSNLVMNLAQRNGQSNFSPTSYIDEEFNKENYYIYAVVAVDAHGNSSNYSNQIGIRWNKAKNIIERVHISPPNAPKPYPNMYIDKDAFVDTIKNEGYSQFTVIFNPEYLQLSKEDGADLKLLAFGPSNFYRLQLINTDLQEDQFVDIKITDRRS